MNQLLLLGGLVLAIYVMNEKKMFKSISSDKNNTLLVVLFCGFILFMCMRKKVEGLILQSDLPGGSCESIGMNQHDIQVVDANDKAAFNTVTVCVTPHGEGVLTNAGPVARDDKTDSSSPSGETGGDEKTPPMSNGRSGNGRNGAERDGNGRNGSQRNGAERDGNMAPKAPTVNPDRAQSLQK
jgi:hypothetical protein